MFKAGLFAAFLLLVGYTLYLATDTITWFVGEAAALALLSVRVCGGLLALLVLVVCVWFLLRQQYERDRQRDGAFALREYWLEPLPRRILNWFLGRPSARAVYDQNANMSHAAVIHNAVYVAEPACGWGPQLAYAQSVEQTRRVQAAVTGDGVTGLPWSNIQRGANGVANAATGRLLAGAYDRTPKPQTIDVAPVPQLPAPMVEPLTPAEAMQESKPAALVLGQTDGGELVRWDMARTPHLRFHGMTRGSGKTNAIQTAAAAALTQGAHVVVFDPANLKDWQDFEGRAELVETSSPATLADGAARLLTIYNNRTRQLARAGVRDVSQMARPPRRILVVIAEFGAQCEMARAEGCIGDVETPLLQLARKAASTGIHLALEDQVVDKWPRGMAGNAVPVIGRMPAYAGQACGYVGRGGVTTETFAPFQFAFEGTMFRAPYMQPALRTLLATVTAPSQLVMLTPPWKAGESVRSQGEGAAVGGGNGVQSGVRPEVANDSANEQPNAEPVGPTDLQAAVWQWRDAHPTGTQAELRANFEARGIVIARGYAHKCFHDWTAQRIEDFTAGRLTEAQTSALFAAGVLGAAGGPLPGAERVNWYNGAA